VLISACAGILPALVKSEAVGWALAVCSWVAVVLSVIVVGKVTYEAVSRDARAA